LIQAFLEDERISAEDRAKIAPVLILWPSVVIPCLTKLVGSAPTPLRVQAIRALGALGRRRNQGADVHVPLALFLKQLDSRSPEVRKAASRAVFPRAKELRDGEITALSRSEFPDVRLLAIQTARLSSAKTADALLSDLILDDDQAVRCGAIREVARRRSNDWEFVMAQSLRDPSEAIARVSVDALLFPRDAATRKLLADFLREKPDAPLSDYIRKRLSPARPPAVSRRQHPSRLPPLRKTAPSSPAVAPRR